MSPEIRTLVAKMLQTASIDGVFDLLDRNCRSWGITRADVVKVKIGMSRSELAAIVLSDNPLLQPAPRPKPAPPVALEADEIEPEANMSRKALERANHLLARRQVETGQYCPVPRAAWLARHGAVA